MSEIFGIGIMGGGGKTDAYAAISVTYPAGATCTCALGSKVLKAPDTSGQALFVVPYAGEWTVTISQSGEEPVSETVNVTESKAYTVALDFGLWLYKNGDLCTAVTGGWADYMAPYTDEYYLNGTLTLNEDSFRLSIVAQGNYGQNIRYITNNGVDITDFNTAYINIKNINLSTWGHFAATNTGVYANPAPASLSLRRAEPGIKSLDISSLSGLYNFFVGIGNSAGGGTSYIEVSEVYLKK